MYEVSFIDEEIEKDRTIFRESHLRNFLEVSFDEKKAPKSEINSYQIALYAHKRFLESQPSEPELTEPASSWTPYDLRRFLNSLYSN